MEKRTFFIGTTAMEGHCFLSGVRQNLKRERLNMAQGTVQWFVKFDVVKGQKGTAAAHVRKIK